MVEQNSKFTYNNGNGHCFQSNSPCFPSSSSLTSSARPQAPPPPMAPASLAQSVRPRVAALMEVVRLDLESAASSAPQHADQPSRPTRPTSGIPATPARTPWVARGRASTRSTRCLMTFASWGSTSRHSLAWSLAPMPATAMTPLQLKDRLERIPRQIFAEQTQIITVKP